MWLVAGLHDRLVADGKHFAGTRIIIGMERGGGATVAELAIAGIA